MKKLVLMMLIALSLVLSGCYGIAYHSLGQYPVIYASPDMSYQFSRPRSTIYVISGSPYRPLRPHRTIYVYPGLAYRSLEPRRAINARFNAYRQRVESHPVINARPDAYRQRVESHPAINVRPDAHRQPVESRPAVNANSVDLHHLIEHTSARYGIPPAFAAAIAQIESNYDSCAVSHMNAQGIMQLIPKTAAELNVSDPYDPVQGVEGGIAYLAQAYRLTHGDLSLSAAYYNAGPKALKMASHRWPRETQNYIRKLVRIWPKFQGENWRRQVPKTIKRTNRQFCSYIVSK